MWSRVRRAGTADGITSSASCKRVGEESTLPSPLAQLGFFRLNLWPPFGYVQKTDRVCVQLFRKALLTASTASAAGSEAQQQELRAKGAGVNGGSNPVHIQSSADLLRPAPTPGAPSIAVNGNEVGTGDGHVPHMLCKCFSLFCRYNTLPLFPTATFFLFFFFFYSLQPFTPTFILQRRCCVATSLEAPQFAIAERFPSIVSTSACVARFSNL